MKTLIIDRKFNLFSSLFLKSCRKCMMFYMISNSQAVVTEYRSPATICDLTD